MKIFKLIRYVHTLQSLRCARLQKLKAIKQTLNTCSVLDTAAAAKSLQLCPTLYDPIDSFFSWCTAQSRLTRPDSPVSTELNC